jgi:hypothetical protein
MRNRRILVGHNPVPVRMGMFILGLFLACQRYSCIVLCTYAYLLVMWPE